MGRPQPPPSLAKYLKEGRCILFAGAGLSRWAGLPTWPKLIEDIFAEVRQERPEGPEAVAELESLIAERKYLEVADHCKERLKQRYATVLSELLQGGNAEVPEPHRLIMRMPFAAWITTNYDQLLEKAYVKERNDWPKVYTHLDAKNFGTLLLDGTPFILKAHGDIYKPETLVLTARDYSTIIHSNPPFNAFFSALLLTRAVLFVGYSLSDPDFRLLFDRQLATFQGEVPERFALMSGVGDIESQVLDRTAGVRVLSYDQGDHGAVLEFLQTLHDQVRPAPVAPVQVVAAPTILEVSPMLPQEAWQLSLRTGIRGIEAALTYGTQTEAVWEEGGPVDWIALLHSLSTLGSGCGVQVGEQDFAEIGRLLASALPAGVSERLRQTVKEGRSGGAPAQMVLRLTPELDRLPWELTWMEDHPLAVGCLLVRAPVGISDAARGLRAIRTPARALLVGDPGNDLQGARDEILQISQLYVEARAAECTCLLGREATVEAVLGAFETGTFDVVHFAGHAWYDAHEVYLALAGEARLTACMLRPALNRHPPAIMMLNSHFTAFVPLGVGVAPDREEQPIKPSVSGRVGFAELAMRTGVGAFIGCFGSPSDESARQLGYNLHRGLLEGEVVSAALCGARQQLALEQPDDPTPHLYLLSGYPDLRF